MTAVNDCSHRHVPGFPPRHQEGAAKCQTRRLRHHAQRVVGRSWRAGACQVCHSTALFHVPALNVTHAAGASFNWPSPSPSSIRSGAFPSRALPHDPCSSTRSPPNSESSQRLRSFQRLGLQCPVGVLLYPCQCCSCVHVVTRPQVRSTWMRQDSPCESRCSRER